MKMCRSFFDMLPVPSSPLWASAALALTQAGCLMGQATEGRGEALTTETYEAVADAYVRDGSRADNNYGTDGRLLIKDATENYNREVFVRFDVPATSKVEKALLRLNVVRLYNTPPVTVQVAAVTDDSWSESRVTWNNKPSSLSVLDQRQIAEEGLVDFDVTEFVREQASSGDGAVSLRVRGSGGESKQLAFGSRERSGAEPVLLVTAASGTDVQTAPEKTEPTGSAVPVADAYVRDGTHSDNNFGTDGRLLNKDSSRGYNREAFLRFNIGGTASVDQALLRLHVIGLYNRGPFTLQVAGVKDNSWSETSITWNNRPSASAELDRKTLTAEGTVDLDVTSFIQEQLAAGSAQVSLKIYSEAGENKMAAFGSRERTGQEPALLLGGPDSSTNLEPEPEPDPEPEPSGDTVLWFDLSKTELGNQSKSDLERIVHGEISIRHGGIGVEDTFVCDGRMGGVCPDYDGSQGRVIGFRHPPNTHYAGTWNGAIRFSGIREGWLTFKVRYSPSWDARKTRGKMWGLGGLAPGGSQTGPDRPPMHCSDVKPGEGWSARRVVHRYGQAVEYMYYPGKERRCADLGWWGREGSTDGSNRHINGKHYTGERDLIRNGRWHTIEQHIDVDAGTITSYIDGRLVSLTTDRPLDEAGAPINMLLAHAYIGSKNDSARLQPKEVWTYYTDITVTKER